MKGNKMYTKGKLKVLNFDDQPKGYSICTENDSELAITAGNRTIDLFNAQRFVLCWNSHDALLEACEDVQLELDLLLGLAKQEPYEDFRKIKMATVETRIKQVKDAIAQAEK